MSLKHACSLAFALMIACGTAKIDIGPETGSETGESPGTDGSSSSDGDSGSTTSAGSAEPSSSGATESSSGASPLTSTGEPTSTSGGEPPAGPCEAFCAQGIDCEQEPLPFEACVAACASDLASFEGECHAVWIAGLECVAGLTCEELAAVNDGLPSACDGALEQQEECASGCEVGGGGGLDGSQCEWMQECPLEPKLEMKCDTETCQCFEDGVQFGECQAEGACLDLATLAGKAEACCGIPEGS